MQQASKCIKSLLKCYKMRNKRQTTMSNVQRANPKKASLNPTFARLENEISLKICERMISMVSIIISHQTP